MDTISQIKHLMSDVSFPPLVLLDGGWGAGKTYFIKNKLIAEIKKNTFSIDKHMYISLYGIGSIPEFRDRLISTYISTNQSSGDYFKAFTGIGASVSKALGDKGVVSGVVNSISGVTSNLLFNKINNRFIIIDDFERIDSDSLKKQIIGECLNIAENKSVKIIVAANEDKISKECRPDIEKAFSGIVSYELNDDDISFIATECLSDDNKEALSDLVKKLPVKVGFKNIRVLKRAIYRFENIYNLLKINDDINLGASTEIVFLSVLNICYAHFEKGFSMDDIKKYSSRYLIDKLIHGNSNKELSNKEEKEQKKKKEINMIFGDNLYSVTDSLVDFCCKYKGVDESLIKGLKLPKKDKAINRLLSLSLPSLDSKSFYEAYEDLKKYIFTAGEKDLNTWKDSVLCIVYLKHNEYIKI